MIPLELPQHTLMPPLELLDVAPMPPLELLDVTLMLPLEVQSYSRGKDVCVAGLCRSVEILHSLSAHIGERHLLGLLIPERWPRNRW